MERQCGIREHRIAENTSRAAGKQANQHRISEQASQQRNPKCSDALRHTCHKKPHVSIRQARSAKNKQQRNKKKDQDYSSEHQRVRGKHPRAQETLQLEMHVCLSSTALTAPTAKQALRERCSAVWVTEQTHTANWYIKLATVQGGKAQQEQAIVR
jgi:hypothetical protein